MRYAVFKANQQAKDTAYRVYVTDCLKMITERAASVSIKSRYYEIINPQKADTRTGDEIVEDIIKRAGLAVRKE